MLRGSVMGVLWVEGMQGLSEPVPPQCAPYQHGDTAVMPELVWEGSHELAAKVRPPSCSILLVSAIARRPLGPFVGRASIALNFVGSDR